VSPYEPIGIQKILIVPLSQRFLLFCSLLFSSFVFVFFCCLFFRSFFFLCFSPSSFCCKEVCLCFDFPSSPFFSLLFFFVIQTFSPSRLVFLFVLFPIFLFLVSLSFFYSVSFICRLPFCERKQPACFNRPRNLNSTFGVVLCVPSPYNTIVSPLCVCPMLVYWLSHP